MTMVENELGELYNPEDFEPPRNPFEKYRELKVLVHTHERVQPKDRVEECEICGAKFRPKAPNAKRCSDECRKEARRRYARERKRRMRAAAAVALALVLLPLTAHADEPLEVMDLPMTFTAVGGDMSHGVAAAIAPQDGGEPISGAVDDGGGYFTEPTETWPQSAPEPPTGWGETTDGYYGYVAEYSELYNDDGPSREMPGWHDGYLETYYNASNHVWAGEWTVDDDGFYHDSTGRYVIGVDKYDTNPNTGEPYRYGDIVETGKGEAVVLDYGQGARVHDFAVTW